MTGEGIGSLASQFVPICIFLHHLRLVNIFSSEFRQLRGFSASRWFSVKNPRLLLCYPIKLNRQQKGHNTTRNPKSRPNPAYQFSSVKKSKLVNRLILCIMANNSNQNHSLSFCTILNLKRKLNKNKSICQFWIQWNQWFESTNYHFKHPRDPL